MLGAYNHYTGLLPFYLVRFLPLKKLDGITEPRSWPLTAYTPQQALIGAAADKAAFMALWNASQVGKHELLGWHAPFGFYVRSYINEYLPYIIADNEEPGQPNWITEDTEEDITGEDGEVITNE